MDKLWGKAQRAVGVLLAFAMLASAAPAQAFADEASAASGSESTSASSDSASAASGESTGASGDSDSAASGESTGASSDSASSAVSSESQDTVTFSMTDDAGTPDVLSNKMCTEDQNTFKNETTDKHVRIYYSKNGEEPVEIESGDKIPVDVVTADSPFIAIEFYIAVDEGYVYDATQTKIRTDYKHSFLDEYGGEVLNLYDEGDLAQLSTPRRYSMGGEKVDFTSAIEKAKEEHNATYAFMYSGVGSLGPVKVSDRYFSIGAKRDENYAEITYRNTYTEEERSTFAQKNQDTELWNGVEEGGMNWTTHEATHEQLAGWSESDSGDAKVEYKLDGTVAPCDDMTLYTVWEPIQYDYTIEYFYDGSEEPGNAPEGAQAGGSAGYGEPVTINPAQSVTVNGQKYILDEENPGKTTIEISDNIEKNKLAVYYVSDRNGDNIPDKDQTVTLTFNAGEHGTLVADGAEATSKEYKLLPGDSYPVVGTDFTVKAQDKWCFTGWDTDYTFSGSVPEEQKSAAYTYTAQYAEDLNHDETPDEDQTVTLTFNAGKHGTLVADGDKVTSKEYKLLPGDSYPVVGRDFTVEAQDNWCFTGWDTDYTFSGSVPEEQESAAYTYTAQYAEDLNHDGKPDEDQTVTLTFNAGEHGTFAEGESGVYTLLPGNAYPAAPAVKVAEGWMLTGWYDANGSQYAAEGEVTDQSASATYTAAYEEDRNGDNIPDKDQQYTVTYAAGENGTVTVAKETAGVQGVAGIRGSKAVANTGYTVDGWYKGNVKIAGGDTLTPDVIKANLNTENGLYKDTTFTARFVPAPQAPAALTGYTVRYLEDGTGYEVASSKTVSGLAVGTTVTETAPDLAGYSLMSDKNPQSITLGGGDNVITFYYRAIGGETGTTTAAAATPAPAATPVIPTTPTAPAAPAATRAPAAAAPSVTAAPTTAPTQEPEEEVVPEEETPQAQEPAEDESIADEETPLAGSTASGWALLNLILAILTALGAVVLVVGYFMGYTSIWRLLSLIPGVGGVAAFLLTEDMSQAMTFVDGWTVLMVIIAVVQIVVAVLSMKAKNDYDESDEDNA